jgi:flagellar biosynthesis component FlhA
MLDCGSRDPRDLAEAARRAIVPDLIRRRGVARLEPLLFDPELERALIRAWTGPGDPVPDPERAVLVRERIAAYASRGLRERAAIVCTATLRPVVADLLARSGIRVEVFAYGELPPELQLLPAEVVNLGDRALAV